MLRIGASACFGLLYVVSASALAASAHVSFVNPENFTDISRYGDEREAGAVRDELARHIERLAAGKLPADLTLEIEVLDIARAGRLESWPDALQDLPLMPNRATRPFVNDIREMRPAGWPSIKLRYQLKHGEQVVASGEETVSDKSYLDRANFYSSDDPLRFEKQMLDRWFRQRLVNRQP